MTTKDDVMDASNFSLIFFQLKIQEALRKKEKFQREHEEVST